MRRIRRSYKAYYLPPYAAREVQEFDSVEVNSGPYKGFTGVVGTASGEDIKIWPYH